MRTLPSTGFSLFGSKTFVVFTTWDENRNLVQEKDFSLHAGTHTANEPQWLSNEVFAS